MFDFQLFFAELKKDWRATLPPTEWRALLYALLVLILTRACMAIVLVSVVTHTLPHPLLVLQIAIHSVGDTQVVWDLVLLFAIAGMQVNPRSRTTDDAGFTRALLPTLVIAAFPLAAALAESADSVRIARSSAHAVGVIVAARALATLRRHRNATPR